MARIFTVIFFFTWIFTSCITNKKVQLLQKEDVNAKDVVLDSVLRSYQLAGFEYRLQPEDILYIDVQSLSDDEVNFFSQEIQNIGQIGQVGGGALIFGYLVDFEGNIQFPVVNKIKVEGLTVFEAQEKIQREAEKFLKEPVVKVRLLNYRVTILGEINQQGTYVLQNNRTSVLDAIGQAGGFSELADRSAVKVIRQKGGKTEVFYIDLLDEKYLETPFYYVYQNDVIVVPPLRQRPYKVDFGRNLGVLISSISLLLLVINLTAN